MFENLTREAVAAFATNLSDDLAEEAGKAVAATERFLEAVTSGKDYREAYAAFLHALGLDAYGRQSGQRLIASGSVASLVWRLAEESRRGDGLRNPYRPDGENWATGELILDRVGDAVLLSELHGRYGKLSGPATADLVVAVANENLGRLAPGKTRVGGKVAYLVRESDQRPERGRWSTYEIEES